MNYIKIPTHFKVGGQQMEVRRVERSDDNCMGICHTTCGIIEIADVVNKQDKQSDSSKVNTFYHELTHAILKTMGESELNENEKFVCCFSSFLTEAMENAYFKEDDEPRNP